MRAKRQRQLADVLADCERELADIRQRGDDGLAPDARVQDVVSRLHDVTATLQMDARRRTRGRFTRLHEWSRPRLGVYEDRIGEPLTVPTSYFRTDPPTPAPGITVVTPSFEQGRYIERTIYSVLSQAYPKLEFVVQDGGSTDETLEVLGRYEPLLGRWSSSPDGGQGDAINRGFTGTHGEIMCYVNSDDLMLPGALAYVARQFSAHPAWDVIYGHALLIDEDDACVGRWVLPAHDDRALDFNFQVLGMFWRRSAWEAAGGEIDVGFRFALDWDLMLRLRDSGSRIVRVPRFLTAFRVHGAQKTQTITATSDAEARRLRLQSTGRAMTGDEAFARSAAYNRRHVAWHLLYNVLERLPRARSEIRVKPPPGAHGASAPPHDQPPGASELVG